jgi:hypothetical protein
MNLTGIIAISGRSGLYKVVAQGKNNLIVQSLEDNKRFPAYASDRISALEDISIYTYEDDVALKIIFDSIFQKENGGPCPSHKDDKAVLEKYLLEILPNYDQERVYPSDVKKLFQWYNLLHKAGELKQDEEVVAEAPETAAETTESAPKAPAKAKTKTTAAKAEKSETEKKEKPAAVKKAPAKKATDKVASPKVTAKPAAAKKVTTKTSTSRGK